MQADLRIRISDRNHNAVIYIAIRVADLVDIAFDAFLARQRGIDHNIVNITKRCSVRFSDVKVLSTVHHLHLPDTAIFPNQKQNYSRSGSHFYAWPIPYKLQKEMPPFVGGHLLFISLMLWRLNGSSVVNYALDFADVKEGTWYTEAVRWAKSEGVAGGYGNGKFGPNDTLTREQMVMMLYRYARYKGCDVSVGEDTNILSFGDATTVAEYAIPAMQWACGSGVVGGKDATDGCGLILDPKGSTTRAELATMVMRCCAEIVK